MCTVCTLCTVYSVCVQYTSPYDVMQEENQFGGRVVSWLVGQNGFRSAASFKQLRMPFRKMYYAIVKAELKFWESRKLVSLIIK